MRTTALLALRRMPAHTAWLIRSGIEAYAQEPGAAYRRKISAHWPTAGRNGPAPPRPRAPPDGPGRCGGGGSSEFEDGDGPACPTPRGRYNRAMDATRLCQPRPKAASASAARHRACRAPCGGPRPVVRPRRGTHMARTICDADRADPAAHGRTTAAGHPGVLWRQCRIRVRMCGDDCAGRIVRTEPRRPTPRAAHVAGGSRTGDNGTGDSAKPRSHRRAPLTTRTLPYRET